MQFILGNFGTGKTHYILQECQQLIQQQKSFWIIVPSRAHKDQILLSLLQQHKQGIIGSPIITLKELQNKLIEAIFPNPLDRPKVLSNFEQFLLLSSIINQNAPQFQSFHSIHNRPELVKMIYRIIQYLRSKDCSTLSSSQAFQTRIADLQLILDHYSSQLNSHQLSDNKSEIDSILNNLSKLEHTFFPDYIFIDGFVDYTGSQFKLLSQLAIFLDSHKSLSLSLVQNNHPITQSTIEQWQTIFPHTQIQLCNHIQQGTMLADGFLNSTSSLSQIKVHEIQASSFYKEVNSIINEICKLQQTQKYKLNDILIISKQIELYSGHLSTALNRSGIPFSLGKDEKLSQNPLIQFIKKIIDFMQNDLDNKGLEFFSRSNYISSELRYAFSLGLSHIKKPVLGKAQAWDYYIDELKNSELLDPQQFNQIHKTILQLCEHLYGLKGHKFPIQQIIEQLINIIKFLGIQEILSASAPLIKHKKIIDQSISKDYSALLKLKEILQTLQSSLSQHQQDQISLQEFSFFFNIITNETRYRNEIPQKDILRIYSPEDARGHFAKAVFILGLNEGQYPSPPKLELFDTYDRTQLNFISQKILGQNLWDTDLDYFQSEKLSFALAISRAQERVYFSRTPTNEKGDYFGISHFLKKIFSIHQPIFRSPDNDNPQDNSWTNPKIFLPYLSAHEYFDKTQIPFKKIKQSNSIDRAIQYLNTLEQANTLYQEEQSLDPTLSCYFGDMSTNSAIIKRYQQEVYISPTSIETIGRCRYRGLWEKICRLQKYKLPEYKPESSDYGTLYHHVLELYIHQTADFSDDEFYQEDLLKQILQEYIEQSPQRKIFELDFYFLFQTLQHYLLNQEKSFRTEYQAKYFELQSGKDVLPNKKIPLGDFVLSLECRIDRINQSQNTAQFAVLDYKKRNKKSYDDYFKIPFNLFQGFLYTKLLQQNQLTPVLRIDYAFLEKRELFTEFPNKYFNSLTEYIEFKNYELICLLILLKQGNFSPFTLKKDLGEDLLNNFISIFGDKVTIESQTKCTYCDFKSMCPRAEKLISKFQKK